jgi:hypothetical protein
MVPAGAGCVSTGRLGLFGPKESDDWESRRSMQEDSAMRLSFLHRKAPFTEGVQGKQGEIPEKSQAEENGRKNIGRGLTD